MTCPYCGTELETSLCYCPYCYIIRSDFVGPLLPIPVPDEVSVGRDLRTGKTVWVKLKEGETL